MRATSENDEIFGADDRVFACCNRNVVYLQECEHPGHTYIPSAIGHKLHCNYCLFDLYASNEPHVNIVDEDYTHCSKCGYGTGVYAAWCEGNTTLYFGKGEVPLVGNEMGEAEVTKVWTGTDVSKSGSQYPKWDESEEPVKNACTNVVFDRTFSSVMPTSCKSWFDGFSELTNIQGLHYLVTAQATSLQNMFSGCSKLKAIDVGMFNTANVENMSSMFYNCALLTEINRLDDTNFQTGNVTDMQRMFAGCPQLTTLNLTGFDTGNVENMREMFCLDSKLATIYASDKWTTAKLNGDENDWHMFYECTNLKGDLGTDFNPEITSKTYALIDGGDDEPGYLSLHNRNLILYDDQENSATINATIGNIHNVTISGRQLNMHGLWNTICLPFDVEKLEYTLWERATIMELSSANVENGILTINFTTANSIKAGKPYIIRWMNETNSESWNDPDFRRVTLCNAEPEQVDAGILTFRGIYDPVNLHGGDQNTLFFGADGQLHYPENDMTVGAFRAYFNVNEETANGVKAFVMSFNGEKQTPTAIESLLTKDSMSDPGTWYTIDGRKLTGKPAKKGLYIHNRKKVIIR